MAANSSGSAIAVKAKECLELFFDGLDMLKVGHSAQWNSLLDQLGRFQIWSANLGVFADVHASLDYRLREVSDVQNLIIQLLTSVEDGLRQCKCVYISSIAFLDVAHLLSRE